MKQRSTRTRMRRTMALTKPMNQLSVTKLLLVAVAAKREYKNFHKGSDLLVVEVYILSTN